MNKVKMNEKLGSPFQVTAGILQFTLVYQFPVLDTYLLNLVGDGYQKWRNMLPCPS